MDTKDQIMNFVNDVKAAQSNLSAAFITLTNAIINLVNDRDAKAITIDGMNVTLSDKDKRIASALANAQEAQDRAVAAESRGFQLEQDLSRRDRDLAHAKAEIERLEKTNEAYLSELVELRPSRSRIDALSRDVQHYLGEIAGLKNERRKLHEVILTIATTVDPVVNPVAEVKPTPTPTPEPEVAKEPVPFVQPEPEPAPTPTPTPMPDPTPTSSVVEWPSYSGHVGQGHGGSPSTPEGGSGGGHGPVFGVA